MGRRIRTRLYFTSESHLHTVLNVFRFAQIGNAKKSLLSHHGKSILNSTPELCYLTQVVMRVFEDSRRPVDDPRRFRMEILFSPGATATPMHMNELDREQDQSRFDTAPLQLIGRDGLTCQEVEDFFEQAIMAGRSDEDSYEMASTSTAAEHIKPKKKKDKKKDKPEKVDGLAVPEGIPEPTPLHRDVSSDGIVLSPPAVVEMSSPSMVEDLSVAPEFHPSEPLHGETSLLTEATDVSAPAFSQSDTQDTVRVKNDAQQKNRGNLADLFPSSIVVKTDNDEVKVNGDNPKEIGTNTSFPRGGKVSLKPELTIPDEDVPKGDTTTTNTFSRKYFWGTVAVASLGVGMTCIVMALTMSNGERRPRRWSSRSY